MAINLALAAVVAFVSSRCLSLALLASLSADCPSKNPIAAPAPIDARPAIAENPNVSGAAPNANNPPVISPAPTAPVVAAVAVLCSVIDILVLAN